MTEFEKLLTQEDAESTIRATVYAMNTLLIHLGIYSTFDLQAKMVEYWKKHGTGGQP